MSRNAWIIFSVVCLAVLGGLIYFSNQNKVSIDAESIDRSSVLPPSEASGNIGDHVAGNPESNVVLVEYVDFQCQGCAGAYPTVKALVAEYSDDVAFVTRNYAFLQPHGMAAAATAEAAGLQGKYSEMVDLLFTNQSSWSTLTAAERDKRFLSYARQLQLDEDRFINDRASSQVRQKISFDKELGSVDGVKSTPAFFLDGEAIDSATFGDKEAMKAKLDAAIKAADQ